MRSIQIRKNFEIKFKEPPEKSILCLPLTFSIFSSQEPVWGHSRWVAAENLSDSSSNGDLSESERILQFNLKLDAHDPLKILELM